MDALAKALDLSDRVAIVTGGTRGIGQAIAHRLMEAGARVVAVSSSATEEPASSGTPRVLRGNVAVKADVDRVVEAVLPHYGRIDILVNCAGVIRRKPALEITEADWTFLLDINLKGVHLMSQAVAPAMQRAARGRIINITSIGAHLALLNRSAYCAAKAGVVQLTRCLALEWGAHGITVNAVSPGIAETLMTGPYLESDPARRQTMVRKIPLRRLGRPDDLAGAVLFLASDLASYITGHVLCVDGGWGLGDPDW